MNGKRRKGEDETTDGTNFRHQSNHLKGTHRKRMMSLIIYKCLSSNEGETQADPQIRHRLNTEESELFL